MTSPPLPAHVVVPGTERHGVTRLARQVAEVTGAAAVSPAEAPHRPWVHAHLTDRLFGATPEAAAAALVDLAGRTRLTVTLHDVPQPTDGVAFQRRRAAYRAILDAATGWVACSQVEAATVTQHCSPSAPGHVVPLPVIPLAHPDRPTLGAQFGARSVGVFGWVYPGKGHDAVLDAAAQLPDPPQVLALGDAAPGHTDLLTDLRRRADRLGVPFSTTGWVADEDVGPRLAGVGVAVAHHANLSASGSLFSWVAAGHRPLVRDGAYAREADDLRPGTMERYQDGELADRLGRRLADPASNRLDGVCLAPTLDDVADAYRAWWRAVA